MAFVDVPTWNVNDLFADDRFEAQKEAILYNNGTNGDQVLDDLIENRGKVGHQYTDLKICTSGRFFFKQDFTQLFKWVIHGEQSKAECQQCEYGNENLTL